MMQVKYVLAYSLFVEIIMANYLHNRDTLCNMNQPESLFDHLPSLVTGEEFTRQLLTNQETSQPHPQSSHRCMFLTIGC